VPLTVADCIAMSTVTAWYPCSYLHAVSCHSQVVVFIANHGTEGTVGLILNRPSPQVLGRQRGGLRFEPVVSGAAGVSDLAEPCHVSTMRPKMPRLMQSRRFSLHAERS
jgi:hypothetical protein